MGTREEAERRQLYDARHALADSDVTRVVELEAVGTDYGNAGFTTKTQADLLADLLDLGPRDTLLDIGSGAGWPGLYLARCSGCRVVVSDISEAGMVQAQRRALGDGMAERAHTVAATARHLPFKPRHFDAIVHTDLLC